ncbi:MAG: MFS transporter [Alicyclobacillus macrosporangiidus]|nr:MFS transporter [Alicyclobacillus macrosporangiidus]
MRASHQTGEHLVLHRRPSALRWWFVVLLLIGAVVNYLDRANLSIANPLISKEFHLSPAEMGILLSAFLWPYALANLPAGWLVDRLGPRRLFAWASGLWSLVTFISGFSRTPTFLLTMRILLGISESPFFTCGLKVTERWFAKEERGLPTSIFNTGSQIANGIAPPLLTLLMLSLGWRGMFMCIGAVGFVVMIAWLLVYRDRPGMAAASSPELDPPVSSPAPPTRRSWLSLFRHPSTWFMIIGNFGVVFTVWVYLTWLPGYLEKSRHLSILHTGWVASIPFLCGIVGVPLGGVISDVFIRRGYKPVTARKIPIVGGAVLAALAVAPVPFVPDIVTCIVLLAIGYFAAALPSGVIWTLAADIAPSEQVASLGAIQNFGGFLGASLAPIVTGLIVQVTDSFDLVFVVGACLLVVAAISYGVFLKRPIEDRV